MITHEKNIDPKSTIKIQQYKYDSTIQIIPHTHHKACKQIRANWNNANPHQPDASKI